MHVTHMKFSMHEENKSLWYEYEFTQKKKHQVEYHTSTTHLLRMNWHKGHKSIHGQIGQIHHLTIICQPMQQFYTL